MAIYCLQCIVPKVEVLKYNGSSENNTLLVYRADLSF
jgi:hypothetical protein